MNTQSLEGVVSILPTPFSADDEVDLISLAGLVDFAVSAGVTAVGTPAFGSEFYKLDDGERTRILETVISHTAGRLPVIAQCNHHSPRKAARLAVKAEQMGASAINIALPRAFASSPRHLLDYARAVCDAVRVPVVVQDWNPAGQPVGLQFTMELRRHCPNFRYLKLEEPGIGHLIRAIRHETGNEVGVFLGWGGMYVLELQPAGACGVMSGLGVADILVRIWQLGREKQWQAALDLFAQIAPFLQFSLQTFEQFHHAEKLLLVARGVLHRSAVRPVTIELSDDARHYLDQLIAQLQPLFKPTRGTPLLND
ncbi:MAG: dihydrodipicolinate synthase family protein [Opitutaceae bacterium]